jgi:hypothetical protein
VDGERLLVRFCFRRRSRTLAGWSFQGSVRFRLSAVLCPSCAFGKNLFLDAKNSRYFGDFHIAALEIYRSSSGLDPYRQRDLLLARDVQTTTDEFQNA